MGKAVKEAQAALDQKMLGRGAEADIEAARCLLRRDGGQPPEHEDRLR